MPVVILRADAVGVIGEESCAELEANDALRVRLESIRIAAGALMGLGDVSSLTVLKMRLVSRAVAGGTIDTRTFIPHRCHEAIGVLGVLSVAAAVLVPDTVAAAAAAHSDDLVVVEHPTGSLDASVTLSTAPNGVITAERSSIIRTARKLMDGYVFARSDEPNQPR